MSAPGSVVVVGAGLAGAATVTALRAAGWAGHLTVLGAEGLAPYDRPPLSKELLGRTSPAWLTAATGMDVGAADVVHLDRPARGLTVGPDGAAVRTDHGEVRADVVVAATGAHAVRPPGWEAAETLHAWPDAERLRARLVPGARLVVVGAGWVGAEVAGVAAAAGVAVTVVEAAAAPLATALGARIGAWTVPWYAEAGVRLVLGRTVATIEPAGTGAVVRLVDGEEIEADVVLAAVGARPATGWLAGVVPLEADGSVRVDTRFVVPGTGGRLLAVGDVALRPSPRHGDVPGGHWDGALRGPAVAVGALLGHAPGAQDDPVPYVFSSQLGRELALHGLPGPDDDVVVRGAPDGPATALWFRGETLTAAFSVDRPRDVAAARRLLGGGSLPRLDRERATDPDHPLRGAVI